MRRGAWLALLGACVAQACWSGCAHRETAAPGGAGSVREESAAPGGAAPVHEEAAAPARADAVARGEYLYRAAGCVNCHTTDGGAPLAGGVAIETAFGTFYGTNITPDPTWGIGAWSDADFVRAMRCGIGPDGRRFYPVFPFPSYTRMTDRDLLDLRAWLATVPPVAKPSPPHRIKPLYRSGLALRLWRSLTFEPGELRPDPTRSAAWNRGAYLVEGPGHCGECHTPRNRVGGLERHLAMAGSPSGAEGHPVPNITPDRETGIGRWSEEELVDFLKTGLLPDGDVTGGLMNRIVRNGTSRLTDADLRAMAVYLRSLPPVRRRVGGEAPAPQKEDW